MDADWDLHAVVRGCCSAVSTTTTTTPSPPLYTYTHQDSSLLYEENCMSFIPDLCQPSSDNSIEQFLNNLYHPLYFPNLQKPPSSPQSIPLSPLSVLERLQDPPYHYQQQQFEKQVLGNRQSLGVSGCTTTHAQGTTKFKKRKNQIKRVCQVPAEESSSDLWCWRKYGQKPIKGSPYPRGYYKCSTSKGCLARKQVERNKSDPGMLILTYTGEHNHPMPTQRNSSAGSSRNKNIKPCDDDYGCNKPAPSSPPPFSQETTSSLGKEKTEEIDKDDTDDDTNFDVSCIDEDILESWDELDGPATGV
ncbi:hypothetical protein QVD17_20582 [Tagetes erecta]|uniref:WRKY domain-containing protein n=1 Tax=Tagetes erecta TaxID=13708 RepID=A0AAD8KLG6_TARER|nr:hypothetical protein QVD17_20582 [Tagetes erecta]